MREPVYHRNNEAYRVISCANGLWQAQRHIGRPETADKRRVSGWDDIGPQTSRDRAIDRMSAAAATHA